MTPKSDAIFFRAHIEADLANTEAEILAQQDAILVAQKRIRELAPKRRALIASLNSLNADPDLAK